MRTESKSEFASLSEMASGWSGSPAISVVISAYSDLRWDDLLAAVESVRRQTTPPLETVIVIDHNVPLFDRTRRHFDGAGGVRPVPNARAPGLSGARNTGVAAARGDVVAFLDDDAIAEPDWLGRLGA